MNEDLNRLGLIDEDEIALDEAALSLALPDHPGTDLTRYLDLLAAMETRLDLIGGDAEPYDPRRAPRPLRRPARRPCARD